MAIVFEHAIEVACSPQVAFAFLDDLPRTPQWLGPCTKLEKLSGGANQVGDQLHYEYSQAGQQGTMTGHIVERIVDQKLVCRYSDKHMEVIVDFTITPAAEGARLVHIVTMTPQSFMMKMAAPMIQRGVAAQTIEAMQNIKRLIESDQA